MNAANIINDTMTLEEKLAAIDAALDVARESADEEAISNGLTGVPFDPQDLLMCEGCQ